MLGRMRKKGDLNLSINAIVVLILAITMLGLGLGFMRNMFSKTTSQFSEVGDTMKEQIINDIRSSNQRLAFDKAEITMKKGEKKDVFYGIRNDLSGSRTFGIRVGCYDALADAGAPVVLANLKFDTFPSRLVKENDIDVVKLVVSVASTAKQTTYSCVMYVCDESVGATPPATACNPARAAITFPANSGSTVPAVQGTYSDKQFYVTVQ